MVFSILVSYYSGFPKFKGDSVSGQNILKKCHDWTKLCTTKIKSCWVDWTRIIKSLCYVIEVEAVEHSIRYMQAHVGAQVRTRNQAVKPRDESEVSLLASPHQTPHRPHRSRVWLTRNLKHSTFAIVGGAVASWLVRSTPDRAVRVRDLAGDIALCSWARHLTFTVPLATQVYKWVPANLMLGVTLLWTSNPSRGE